MNSSRLVSAGAFVVVGALLFTVGLFMIGERRMLFQDRFPLFTEFATVGQLEIGATVRVAGLDAGQVSDVLIPLSPEQPFRVRMEVREDLHHLIRTDSVATTQTEGLVGAMFINISAGTDRAPRIEEGGTVPGREPLLLSDLLQQASDSITLVTETVEMLRGDVQRAVGELALTVEGAHALIDDVRPAIVAMAENGNRISADTQAIMASINSGEGTIGKLIHDDALYEQVREIAEEATTVVASVREMSSEARLAIADFRSADGPAQGLMADVRVTLSQARAATAGLADNMEAMKHNFLLRGFFNRRGYFNLDLISPEQYRTGVLENGNRQALRIWLSADVLFEPGPDGTEMLTPGGRARLDSGIATYLRYLPVNPLVVEGYATDGTVGERFRRGRSRSGMVREYLMGRFALAPQHTGYIALGEAEGSPAGEPWDGVALTLFLDRDDLSFAGQEAVPVSVAPVLDAVQ